MDNEKTPRLAQGREHIVATVDEIPPGKHKLVPIGRHGVGVYNVNGTFYAIANYCPHEGGPLCSGRARGRNVVDESVPGVRRGVQKTSSSQLRATSRNLSRTSFTSASWCREVRPRQRPRPAPGGR